MAEEGRRRNKDLHNKQHNEGIKIHANPSSHITCQSARNRERNHPRGKANTVQIHGALCISLQNTQRHQRKEHAGVPQAPHRPSVVHPQAVCEPGEEQQNHLRDHRQPHVHATGERADERPQEKAHMTPLGLQRNQTQQCTQIHSHVQKTQVTKGGSKDTPDLSFLYDGIVTRGYLNCIHL